ncbi:MAG: nucleotidyl transferase AbiEii/AbiGii toxin family protein [Patescibacteria group bacterium]
METTSAVSEATRKDLDVLISAGVTDGFYLAGGTALAFLLSHRESHDLDFFMRDAFDEDALTARLEIAGTFSLEKKEKGTVRGMFGATLVSFFHYPYPLLEDPHMRERVMLASLADIACMKLDALASRGARRDFVDMYVILHEQGFSLPRLLQLFAEKYASLDYNLLHIQKGLVYFEDAERDPMPRMIRPVAWQDIKDFFIAETAKIRHVGNSA